MQDILLVIKLLVKKSDTFLMLTFVLQMVTLKIICKADCTEHVIYGSFRLIQSDECLMLIISIIPSTKPAWSPVSRQCTIFRYLCIATSCLCKFMMKTTIWCYNQFCLGVILYLVSKCSFKILLCIAIINQLLLTLRISLKFP